LDSTANVARQEIPAPPTDGQPETGLIIGRAADPGKEANAACAIIDGFLADRSRAEKARPSLLGERHSMAPVGTAGNNPAF
jgi:hypothetical protein